MDRRLVEAVLKGDVSTFLSLAQEEEDIIKQVVSGSLNTVLHLAARFGHLELASEIVNLRPELASAENEKLETPLHEACREGRVEIVALLMEVDPWIAPKVNRNDESVLFVGCERGKLDVVKHLLVNHSWLLMLELDAPTISLHAAASGGHTVKETIRERPDFSWKKGSQ
uniref:Uncharacterized protein n=1 Tax=Vitis vinifera TaxID=29760 RepID=F6H3E3_VITVI